MSTPYIRKTYELLASHIAAYHNCKASGNTVWLNRHAAAVEQICKDVLPHGSGIDNGCSIDLDCCLPDRLIVIQTSFHHMDEGGFYDGWTEHAIRVQPSFIGGIAISVTGRNRNAIKEYLGDTFHEVLSWNVIESWDEARERYEYKILGRHGS